MTHGGTHFTPPQLPESSRLTEDKQLTPQQQCREDGGRWDAQSRTCIFIKEPKEEVRPPRAEATRPEVIRTKEGKVSGLTLPGGRTFLGIDEDDIQQILQARQEKEARLAGTQPLGTAQEASDVAFRGEQLVGGIGQFEQLGISPTGLDVGEALTTGVVDAIPSALSLAGQFAAGAAVIGAAATAPAGGIGAVPAAAVGAAVGFVTGMTRSITSNFKSQRRDTTTAQQRTLDEGKQTMQDWVTLAKNDPVNKVRYLAEFNKQAAQIDQAYRQMKLDTSKDLAKFETALPNLAEFETFYSSGGERDALNEDMRISLLAQAPPNYDMIELAFRRREQ